MNLTARYLQRKTKVYSFIFSATIFCFFQFCVIVFFSSCSKDPALWEVKNLNNNTVSAFGHGGMGIAFKYPIDSYESFEPCMRIGADGTEMDVQLTKDSVLILFHDQQLKDATLCTGKVNDKNWSEIKDCILASPYSTNINIITASYLLSKVDLENKTFTFDCKLYKADNQQYNTFLTTYANALIKLMDDYKIRHEAFVESNDINFLRILKSKDPEIKLFIYPTDFDSALDIAKSMDLYGITIATTAITKEQVKKAHDANKRITVWNVENEKDNIDAVQKNVDFIQSDKIIHLLKMLDKYK